MKSGSLCALLWRILYQETSNSQRGSTRSVYEAKWTTFTEWCLSNQVDFRAPPLKAIADFLLYLFQDKKLQPGTIDGYRSAIADKLGNVPINVSKDENLTRLLDSFHTDRPKWSYQPWPHLWTSHSRVTGLYIQSEPYATTWTGPQILGRTRSWSLSPSKKGLTKTSHLPLSPHGSNRL